jgi:hypothetical protein
VVLQNCFNLERDVPGSCSETCPASSHDANRDINIKVEPVSDVEEEDPFKFRRMKAEHEVSCMSVCLLCCMCHRCQELPVVILISIYPSFQMKHHHAG